MPALRLVGPAGLQVQCGRRSGPGPAGLRAGNPNCEYYRDGSPDWAVSESERASLRRRMAERRAGPPAGRSRPAANQAWSLQLRLALSGTVASARALALTETPAPDRVAVTGRY